MKNIVKIKESYLHRIVRESISRVMNESIVKTSNHLPSNCYKVLEEISKHPWTWKPFFDWVSHQNLNHIYLVRLNGKFLYYKADENAYLIDMYFDEAKPFQRLDFAQVKINGKYNMLNINGYFLLSDWVDYIDYNIWDSNENTFVIQYNDSKKYTIVNRNGEIIYHSKIPHYRVTTKRQM